VGVSLAIINPFDTKSNRIVVQSSGNYIKAYDWSPDDRQIVFCEFYSNVASKLWLMDVSSGKKELLCSDVGNNYYGSPRFSKDGKGIYVRTDRDSEFRRLAYLHLRTNKLNYLTTDLTWDIDEFELSPDGKNLAFISNEDGISHLYMLNIVTGHRKAISSLPIGVVSNLKWHNNSKDLAFNFKSPRAPNDVYALNTESGLLQQWTKSFKAGVDPEKLVIPELIHWKSFDGREISGFLYRPPSVFTGKRPVIIDIHGGPEEQYRPEYGYRGNFFISELGIVKIHPNVRGSSGYGRTFLNLDNGLSREDAVKDIGALLDWIRIQPTLDADRVIIQGGSYGGYLALSVATLFNNRIKGVISDCGPSNLLTMVENTTEWRRSIQRTEFGDERDSRIRRFMQKIAPINNIQRIKTPLLLIQGKNDPRVPVSESEAIIQSAKKEGKLVWYLQANNEGHGFVQRENSEFRFYVMAVFVKEYLLN
jgi:dipeptidyl aminopeptidase/acylaminoacyl peptidase